MSPYLFALFCFVFTAATVDAKGCCTPDQWEGFQGSVAGYVKGFLRRKPGVERGAVYVFYDYTNQRTAAFANYTGDAGMRSYRIVRRYEGEQGQLYVVDLKNGKCFQKTLKKPFRAACIPDKARELGQFYFGAGDQTLQAKSYMLRFDDDKYKMEFTVSVTADSCVPIGENIISVARGIPVMENVGFINIKPGISDPSVFDVPRQCQQQVEMVPIMDELVDDHKILAIL